MSIQNQRDIARLIVKYRESNLSADEERSLKRWREESVRHEAAFQKYLSDNFYREMGTLYKPGEEAQLYKSLRKQLIPRRMKKLRGGVIWSSAAILLLLFAWGAMHYFSATDVSEEAWAPQECIEKIEPGSRQAVLYLPDGQTQKLVASARQIHVNGLTKVLVTDGAELVFPEMKPEDQLVQGMNRIAVPRGGEYRLRLSDKTHIYLNSESELQFPTLFNTESREVAFSGEAYFQVASTEPRQPFVINTAMGKVEVLGTAFNLRCYDSSGLLQLTLEEGTVRFVTLDGKQQAEVHPGEQLVYDSREDSISLQCVPTYLYTSWKDGIYSLDQTPLEQIMEDLSRWYDVPVVYESDDLKHITFTGEIKRYENFGEVMQIFELTKRIRFRMKGNDIHIVRE